jgi:hypothetical protein
LLDRFYIFLK